VRYRAKLGGPEARWTEIKAERRKIEDRFLANDPRVDHFTATLRHLQPATEYVYSVGGPSEDARSEPAEFSTAPTGSARFTFVFLSDTHNSPVCGKLLAHALSRFPATAFCTITGDLVSTGQYRDDWDQFFDATRLFANRRPLVPVVGNHDTLDGLGADLYLTLFGLPANGARHVQTGRSYSLTYGNALFLILDATSSVEDQTPWLEAQLARSQATWKFALFHFPPYAPDDNNPDIVRQWCPVFDKHHVDFVLGGHVHHSLRTHPLNHGQVVSSPDKGTIYLLTVAVPNHALTQPKPDYVAALDQSGLPVYQVFTIDGNRLVTRSCDLEGRILDELVIEK
jgi:predicted phosphodiesterase